MMEIRSQQGTRFSGQTALVTGASRGLGREIARQLAQEGASVCVNYVARVAEADSLVGEIRATGGRAIAVQADVGEPGQIERMMEEVTKEFGPISLLVNNAGVVVAGVFRNHPTQMSFLVNAPPPPTPQVLGPRIPSPIFRISCRPPTYEGKPITV